MSYTRTLAALTICMSVIAGCGSLAALISPGHGYRAKDLTPEAVCGPKPELVVGERRDRLADLDAWLEAQVKERRPADLEMFRDLFQADPNKRRRQVEACHETLNR